MFSLPVLEHQLVMYVTADPETFTEPFDLGKVPVVSRDQADAEERTKKLTAATPTLKAPSSGPKAAKPSAEQNAAAANAAQQKYIEELQRIPEIAAYGNLLKSSPLVELTESETEYVVSVIKHIFKEAIVLQFDIKNTLDATVLTDVTVVSIPTDEDEAGFEEDFIIPAAALRTNEPGVVYCAFKNAGAAFAAATFSNTLKFTSKEIDPTTNEPEDTGYDDEYQVEDLDLTGADYVLPAYAGSFDNVWEQSNGEEASETLQLSNMKSIAGTSQLRKAYT
jgi:coatomer protein complex subunit gamma